MIKIPNLNDPATRLRMLETAGEIVAELPRDPGEALAVLALLLARQADEAGDLGAALVLAQDAIRCYGSNMYEERVTVEVRETATDAEVREALRKGRPKRVSARAKQEGS